MLTSFEVSPRMFFELIYLLTQIKIIMQPRITFNICFPHTYLPCKYVFNTVVKFNEKGGLSVEEYIYIFLYQQCSQPQLFSSVRLLIPIGNYVMPRKSIFVVVVGNNQTFFPNTDINYIPHDEKLQYIYNNILIISVKYNAEELE